MVDIDMEREYSTSDNFVSLVWSIEMWVLTTMLEEKNWLHTLPWDAPQIVLHVARRREAQGPMIQMWWLVAEKFGAVRKLHRHLHLYFVVVPCLPTFRVPTRSLLLIVEWDLQGSAVLFLGYFEVDANPVPRLMKMDPVSDFPQSLNLR